MHFLASLAIKGVWHYIFSDKLYIFTWDVHMELVGFENIDDEFVLVFKLRSAIEWFNPVRTRETKWHNIHESEVL